MDPHDRHPGAAHRAAALEAGRLRLAREANSDLVGRLLPSTELFGGLVQSMGESLDWRLAAVWGASPKPNELRCVALWSAPGAGLEDLRADALGRTFSPGQGLPGTVWVAGFPLWRSDATADRDCRRCSLARAAGLRTQVAFPIVAGERVHGVVESFAEKAGGPSKPVLHWLAAEGSRIGRGLERGP